MIAPELTLAVDLRTAADQLSYRDTKSVVRLIKAGRLRAFRSIGYTGIPGAWRVSTASIQELLAEQRHES